MSTIEYNSLLFEISERIDELNALQRLVFICRGKLTQSGSGNVHDGLSLFKELEEHGYLGIDRLKLMKELLKSVKEWSLIGKVKKFENKRKEYKGLLEKIICALDELNDMERLITLCRGNIREGNIGNIVDVRSLFEELENQETLGIDCLDVVKVILAETGKTDLFKEVEEFEERRDQEDEFEAKKEQRAALMSSVRSTLMGVVNMKTVFKLFAGGLVIVSATEVLSGWSSYDQLVAAVQSCVLPAGTSLVQITDGCVCLTVQAESLSALTNLWKLYQDGTLQKRMYDFFVTEVRELAEGEDVEVNVTIDEGEYQKACIELIPGVQGGATIDYVERRRRNSDSAVYFNAKELPPSRLKCLETEVKYLHNRIALLEDKKENLGSHPFERNEIAPTGSPDKKFGDKFPVSREKIKESDKKGVSQPDGAVLMGAEKLAFVQKYLDDVQETRSTTTETSDSALGIHAATSEFETEEVRGTSGLCLKDLSPDVRRELIERLRDEGVRQNFLRFFGLQRNIHLNFYDPGEGIFDHIGYFFPDTPISVLKECFEALQLYDFVEFLAAKVRPRSLHSVLSPEEVEKLKTGNLPTNFHSNTFVLIINDTAESVNAQKIEKFCRDLNLRNVVTLIDSTLKVEKRRELCDLKRKNQRKINLEQVDKKTMLSLESEDRSGYSHYRVTEHRKERLRTLRDNLAILRKELDKKSELMKELEERNERAQTNVLKTMENLLRDQEKCTCIAVFFIISEDSSILNSSTLNKVVAKTLALFPNHTKLLVGAPSSKWIGGLPESLIVKFSNIPADFFVSSMIEIFNKRWYTLDLLSMMQELKRTLELTSSRYVVKIESKMSTLPRFEKEMVKGV